MLRLIARWGLVAGVMASLPVAGWGQDPRPVNTMFGARTFGQPLNPGVPTTFWPGGLLTAPNGSFTGINANDRTQMFRGLPWQSPPQAGGVTQEYVQAQSGLAAPSTQQAAAQQMAGRQAEAQQMAGRQAANAAAAATAPATPATAAGTAGPAELPQGIRQPATAAAENAAAAGAARVAPRPVQADFNFPSVGGQAATALAGRIEQTGQINKLSPITIRMQGSTAVLEGRVATPHDRLLAEEMARLEPGIWNVKNELVVGR